MDTDRKVISFVDKRRDICDKCEHLTSFVGVKSCEVCGCAIWTKIRIKNTKCPKDKWGVED